jgi:superfamily II DNA or RNA helicase
MMGNLSKFVLKPKYATYSDDLVQDFYNPILSESSLYKRAVGYFSSTALIEYAIGLKQFIKNGGKIKLIMSPFLYGNDLKQVEDAFDENYQVAQINALFETYLNSSDKSFVSVKILFYLIKLKLLEVKIAIPRNNRGIFHEKIAIFEDELNHKIAISGSNNETQNALAFNSESFSAFASWKEGQNEYVKAYEDGFDDLWNEKNGNIIVIDIKNALTNKILTRLNSEKSLDELYEELKGTGSKVLEFVGRKKLPFKLYGYQQNAIEKWKKNQFNGIFKFATGSGKTKTAIKIIDEMHEIGTQFSVIVVPDKTLNHQWADELKSYGWHIIQCFSDNPRWLLELKDEIDIALVDPATEVNLIVTLDTFFGENFQNQLNKLNSNYLLVVDECHTWGTEAILSNLPDARLKLGLSATPELHFSQQKTERLIRYFNGIVSEYSIENAMKDDKLVGYYYHPIFVSLNAIEKEQYNQLTQKIVKSLGFDPADMGDRVQNKILEQLLFKRSRLVYGANNKLSELMALVKELKQKSALKNLLIYCGSTSYNEDYSKDVNDDAQTQIEKVNRLLSNEGIIFTQYTSKENEFEKKAALEAFKNGTYATLVAIKCLDEGVNIPQVERAIILSSSTNPREFIQRRGRILRHSDNKKHAEIFDFIVLDKEYASLNKKEIDRFYEFARISLNSVENLSIYDKLINDYGGKLNG